MLPKKDKAKKTAALLDKKKGRVEQLEMGPPGGFDEELKDKKKKKKKDEIAMPVYGHGQF